MAVCFGASCIPIRLATSTTCCFPACSVFYVYYEQYLTITKDTALALGYSLLVLFVVMTVLNGLDVRASLIVSVIVVVILVEMMAIMALWGITLNAVSMVNLVVAMGIAVEFNSHVMHAFQKSSKSGRRARALDALVHTGSSVSRPLPSPAAIGGVL